MEGKHVKTKRSNKKVKKKNKSFKYLISFFIVLIIIFLGLLFIPETNSILRNDLGIQDTPVDVLAKKMIDINLKDKNFENKDKYLEIINTTPTVEITTAAKTKDGIKQFLVNKAGINDEIANIIANETFENEELNQIRETIKDGNWYKLSSQTKELINSGTYDELKNKFSDSNLSDYKGLQDEATSNLIQ